MVFEKNHLWERLPAAIKLIRGDAIAAAPHTSKVIVSLKKIINACYFLNRKVEP